MKRPPGLWLLLSAGVLWLCFQDVSCVRATSLIFGKATTTTTTTTTAAPGSEPAAEEETVTEVPENTNATKLTGIPQVDYVLDPNLPRELNGHNLTDYPFYDRLPPPEEFDFKCDGLHDGFYASVPHSCQVYHHCLYGTRYDFLCANYTAFDQKTFICHFASEVDCANSKKFWHRNDALYIALSTTTVKPPVIVYSPPPPSPVLTGGAARRPSPSGVGAGGRRRKPLNRRRRPYDYYEDYEEEDEYYEEPRYTATESSRGRRKRPRPRPRPVYDDEYEEEYEDERYDRRRTSARRGEDERRPYDRRTRPPSRRNKEDRRKYDEEYDEELEDEDPRFDRSEDRKNKRTKSDRKPDERDEDRRTDDKDRRNDDRDKERRTDDRNKERRTDDRDKERSTDDRDKERRNDNRDKERRTDERDKDRRSDERDKDRRSDERDKDRRTEDRKEKRPSDDRRYDKRRPEDAEDDRRHRNRKGSRKPVQEDEYEDDLLDDKPPNRKANEEKREEAVTDENKPLVKPIGSLFDRPRAPPRIRPPVPKSEADKYSFKTTTSKSSKVADEEYYDEYEDELPPKRSRPSKADTVDARKPLKTREEARESRKPLASRSRGAAPRKPVSEEYEEYEDEKPKRTTKPKNEGRRVGAGSRKRPAYEEYDDYDDNVKNSTTTTTTSRNPFYKDRKHGLNKDGLRTSTTTTTTSTTTTTTTEASREEPIKQTVRVVKRPFLPSRGGNPYVARGLQPLGLKAEIVKQDTPRDSDEKPSEAPVTEAPPADRPIFKTSPIITKAPVRARYQPEDDDEFRPVSNRPVNINRYKSIQEFETRTTLKPKLIEKNPLDINENEYDVTLNDALNPTLPNLPVRSFPTGFSPATDYTYSSFQRPRYVVDATINQASSEYNYRYKQPQQRYEIAQQARVERDYPTHNSGEQIFRPSQRVTYYTTY